MSATKAFRLSVSLSNVFGNINIKPVPAAAVNQLKRMYKI